MFVRLKNIRLLIIITFLFLFSYVQLLQSSISSNISNISIINSKLDSAAISLTDNLKNLGIDTIYTDIKTSESDRYFNSILVNAASEKITFYFAERDSNKMPYLNIKLQIETNYKNYENDSDSLNRKITIHWTGIIISENNKMLPLKLTDVNFNDIISRDNAEKFNKTDFNFAKSEIPEPPSSFWKDIIQPVAIISAAAITVLLLFTMRSN